MTRVRWRASVVVVVSSAAWPSADAQTTLGTDVRAAAVGAAARGRWLGHQVVASSLRLERPWLTLGADGAMTTDQRGRWRMDGALDAALLMPTPFGGRLALVGTLGERGRDTPMIDARSSIGATLSRRSGGGGAWLGAELSRPNGLGADTPGAPGLDVMSGVWRQIRSVVITASLSSRAGGSAGPLAQQVSSRHDTTFTQSRGGRVTGSNHAAQADSTTPLVTRRWSEVEGRVHWERERVSGELAVGARLFGLGVRPAAWASANGALLVSRRVAVVGGVGTVPVGLSPRAATHRVASLGLRLTRGSRLADPLQVEVQPAAISFELHEVAAGRYRIALRVPRARMVEVTGDFTGWNPVTLEPGRDGWWQTILSIAPGTHHVNIRVNGDRWVAPPGATAVSDDFAGTVGVVVVR